MVRLFIGLVFIVTALQSHAQSVRIIGGGYPTGDIAITTSSEQNAKVGRNTLNGQGLLPNQNAASRFLAQATLGADIELIDHVSNVGITQWLDDQLNMPASFSMSDYLFDLIDLAQDSLDALGDPEPFPAPTRFWYYAWWKHVIDGDDLVRARIALALSEILVVSENSILGSRPLGLANYYDILLEHAFGNYRDLLGEITRHPSMGVYLTYIHNPKTDTVANNFPDENYAREIMQLFTIGLHELNNNGTPKLDNQGKLIPSYDNDDIGEFAKVFTGFTWATAAGFGMGPVAYDQPMQMWESEHEPGEKFLLNGYVVPDRNPVNGLADVDDALDNLFNHQNMGPFISRRLIQRLITSNPSPAYIDRVASVFNDDGNGVRGNLKEVFRAIFLDPEARACAQQQKDLVGYLREPLLRYTHICRAFNAASADGHFRSTMTEFQRLLLQKPLASPSVFNFFQPDYQPNGPVEMADLVAPEFQIFNSQSSVGYGTMLNGWAMDEKKLIEYGFLFPGETYVEANRAKIDLSDEIDISTTNDIDALVERYNVILCHGNMSEVTRNLITNMLAETDEAQAEIRARLGLFLVMMSPDYLIMR